MLFIGTHEVKLDKKSRVCLPSSFRDLLRSNRSFYTFFSPSFNCFEACHLSYLEKMMLNIEEQIDVFSQEEDALTQLLADSRKISFDVTGRFIVPPLMLDYFTDNKILFIGKGSRFQIWKSKDYYLHRSKAKIDMKKLSLLFKQ